jgi:DNA polymerase III alpha subunit
MSYVELHACSAFSFLRGGSLPEQLAEVAAELELPAMALLDRNGVYGAQRFSVAAREQKVRPIIGAELTMEDGSLLPVLVASRLGYANLCSLLTQAHLRSSVKGECAVRWDELPEFAEGLVALFGNNVSHDLPGSARHPERSRGIPLPSLKGNMAGVRAGRAVLDCARDDRAVKRLIEAFRRENVYVDVQRHF